MLDCIKCSRAIVWAKDTSLEVYQGTLAARESREVYPGSSEQPSLTSRSTKRWSEYNEK